MKPLVHCLAIAAILAAGCASGPAPNEEPAAVAAQRATSAEETDATGNVLTLRADTLDSNSEIVCREMLLHASNVIKKRCMSRDSWKTYDRVEAMRALQIVRRMQGSAY